MISSILINVLRVKGLSWVIKNLPECWKPPAMQEMWVQSLGQEDPPGEGNGNPLQYSCLGSSGDRGAWWAAGHGVAKGGHNLVTKLQPPISE